MFCVHCGAQQEDGAKFCTSCGKPLDTEAPQAAPQPQEGPVAVEAPPAPKQVNPLVAKLKALPKWVYAAVVGGIAVIVAAILIVVNITSTINLNDFVTIEVEGYDGYGTAMISIDWDAMKAKYGDKVKFTKEAKEEMGALGGFLDGVSAFDGLRGSIYVSLDTDEDLSNGDEIHYTWDIDDELFKYVSCKLKYTEGTYTVEGLEEAQTFDPFADLTVTFEGISTNGQLNINYSGQELSTYDFSSDTAYGLANGDTVTFRWNCDADTAQQEHNAVLAPEDATFTVEGLDEWVTALDQIGQTDWDTLAAAGEDALRQREGDAITGAECLGGYMLVRQDFSSEMVDVHNMLYAAYKVEAKLPDSSSLTYYAGVGFGDLVLHGDGSVEVTGDYGFMAYGNIDVKAGGDYYNFTGFETLEDMNTECIDGYQGMYSVESNVTEAAA